MTADRQELARRLAALSPEKRALLSLKLKQRRQGKSDQPAITTRPDPADLPLSFAQQRMWLIDQIDPGSAAYRFVNATRMRGHLDVSALSRAFSEIVKRHSVLRATFHNRDGQPVQVISPATPVEIPIEDLSTITATDREAAARAWLRREAQRSLDLARGPLWRIHLLRLGERDHILVHSMHHITGDGWSTGVAARELTALYNAFCAGKPPRLPELPIQYADFAYWQRQRMRGRVRDEHLAYWTDRLAGAPAMVTLPTDRPRPANRHNRGGAVRLTLPSDLVRRLFAFARDEGCTEFMVLVSGFLALIHRYTRQEDLVVGTVIANRNQRETEGLVGFFANTLPLRCELTNDMGFRQLINRVKELTLDASAHQDLPFEMLVEALQPERTLSHTPIFQMMFVLHNAPMPDGDLTGLKLERFELETETARFDMTLDVIRDGDDLILSLTYDRDLYDRATAARVLDHMQSIFDNALAGPDRALSALPLLTPAERQMVLVDWNDTDQDYCNPPCLHQMVEAQTERTPDRIALVAGDETLTYAELDRRANRVANYLLAAGVSPLALVAIHLERSIDMIVAILGVLKAGAGYVPLDATYPTERLTYVLGDCGASVVITRASLAQRMSLGTARLLCLDRDAAEIARCSDSRPPSSATADSVAYVIYTSGSTGRPKGVVLLHGGVCDRIAWMQATFELTASDRVLQKTPLGFDVSVWEIFWPLASGALLVLAKSGGQRDIPYLLRTISEHEITVIHFVPSVLEAVLQEPELDACQSLRLVFSGGEALSKKLAQHFFDRVDAALYNVYGPTEASIRATYYACSPDDDRPIIPIGRPVANTRIYILDGHMNPVPIGVPGEIYIGGVGLAREYHGRPELTAECFVPGGDAYLYKTGDLARYRDDGHIEFLGRVDNQVKLHGQRVELDEITARLQTHPAVRRAIVSVVELTPGDRRLVAHIVADDSQPVPEAHQLRDYLAAWMPAHMVPASYTVIDKVPLTANGKIDYAALAELVGETKRPVDHTAVPRNRLEETLLAIWRRALGAERIGIWDNFFDLGGNSLLLVKVHSEIRKELDAGVPMIDLFKYPTLATLAGHLSARGEASAEIPVAAIRDRADSKRRARGRRAARRASQERQR